TVTPAWTGSTYSEGYSVWIDYNIDGDFADTGEQVWTRAATTTTPVSGSFTVPATAATGATRMRVSMKYNGIPTSCETFSYGEVEDYTVNIQPGTPDTQAPSTPANLAASGITQTSANLSWTASTDNVGVTGYEVRVNGVLNGSPAGTTYALTGLSAGTTYAVTVRAKDAAGNQSADASVSVTTLSVAWCASKGNSVVDEYINRVQLGTINNLSGANAGYGNFTALSTNLGRSTAYTITVTPAWTGTVYSEGYAVWIDYNRDGDFADSGEQVWTRSATTTTPVSGTFTVPATAAVGSTRMRVSMKYNGIPTSCETFSYGEVEDYTVNIQVGSSSLALEETRLEGNIGVYPNPVKGRLFVEVPVEATVVSMHIVSSSGTATRVASYENGIDVSNLAAGLYILSIQTDRGLLNRKFLKE
ncbi:MAG TPA: GEVED domain-containing protein, partial [Ohtaekwangia sp.]